jgi:restriction system protein
MAIWSHTETSDDIDVLHMYGLTCPFCRSRLVAKDVRHLWPGIPADVIFNHRYTVELQAEISGERVLQELDPLYDPEEDETNCYCCPACGWWSVAKKIYISTKHQLWETYYGTSGALRKPALRDLTEPVSEIRGYLTAKYQDRFMLHPRKLEEVVSSIFASLGYETSLTTFSRDGGIDVILRDKSDVIAVQVKRYKNSIEIEQIRSFLGALLIGGHTRGVYVTTSRFQAGSKALTTQAYARGIHMDLVDAEKLFELLKLAQIKDFDRYPEFPLWSVEKSRPQLRFVAEQHLNSL